MIEAFQEWLYFVFVEQFNMWVVLGFFAQFLFMMRFAVQWVASERAGRSIVPVAFWFFSVGGGVLMLIYAISRQDPVFIAGQSLGLAVYLRNLRLIFKKKNREAAKDEAL